MTLPSTMTPPARNRPMALPYCPVPPAAARVSRMRLLRTMVPSSPLALRQTRMPFSAERSTVLPSMASPDRVGRDAPAAALQHQPVAAEAFDRAIRQAQARDVAEAQQALLAGAGAAAALEGHALDGERLHLLGRQQIPFASKRQPRLAGMSDEMRAVREAQAASRRQPGRNLPWPAARCRLVDLPLDARRVGLRACDGGRKRQSGTDQSQNGAAGRHHAARAARRGPVVSA
jgi:hypothetical protein